MILLLKTGPKVRCKRRGKAFKRMIEIASDREMRKRGWEGINRLVEDSNNRKIRKKRRKIFGKIQRSNKTIASAKMRKKRRKRFGKICSAWSQIQRGEGGQVTSVILLAFNLDFPYFDLLRIKLKWEKEEDY